VFEEFWRKFRGLFSLPNIITQIKARRFEMNGACNIGDGHGKGGARKMRDGDEMDGTSAMSDTDSKFLQNCCQKL
jgi:hypothetical protein